MLVLIRLDFVELNCADGCLVWIELPQFMEGDDLLILDKPALFGHLLFLDVFGFLVRAGTDFWDPRTDTLVVNRAIEAGI